MIVSLHLSEFLLNEVMVGFGRVKQLDNLEGLFVATLFDDYAG